MPNRYYNHGLSITSLLNLGERRMDCVFDRTADAGVLKCLTSGAAASHEAVAIDVACAISAMDVTRGLDRLARRRGLAQSGRSDNGKAFCKQSDGALGTGGWLDGVRDRSGETQSKRRGRIIQRSPPRCVPQATLVPNAAVRPRRDRTRRTWRAHTRKLWQTVARIADVISSRSAILGGVEHLPGKGRRQAATGRRWLR